MEAWICMLNGKRANPQLASCPPPPPALQNETPVPLPARLQLLPPPSALSSHTPHTISSSTGTAGCNFTMHSSPHNSSLS
eukprot:3627799-Amphidinium_carterae.1